MESNPEEKYEKIPYEKLVRDGIPAKLDSVDEIYEVRIATDEEFRIELFKKLREELGEFEKAWEIEELADIVEVIEALKTLPEYTELESVRIAKREERGGFEGRIICKGKK